ncbi:MAG: AIG2-like family protein [Firmicutes bacterium ADurb.Bin456]|nr:MAG: AIG2-like family protein [Firmicutes bacterium ADurb.Bin456]
MGKDQRCHQADGQAQGGGLAITRQQNVTVRLKRLADIFPPVIYRKKGCREVIKTIKRVFVYGTLMTGMNNHHLIKPYLENIQQGKTAGILYDLPYGYPAIIPGNGTVYGEVMGPHNLGEALKVLDRLECVIGRCSEARRLLIG